MLYPRAVHHGCNLEVVIAGKRTADNIFIEGDADVITHAQDTVRGLRHSKWLGLQHILVNGYLVAGTCNLATTVRAYGEHPEAVETIALAMHVVNVVHTGLFWQQQFPIRQLVGIKHVFLQVGPIGGTWSKALDAETFQVGIVAIKLVERDAQGVIGDGVHDILVKSQVY